jgi:cell division protein FtsW
LPFSESDFIFSIICEELGLFGASLVMLVFAVIIFCCIRVAKHAKDRFGGLLASGIATVIASQTLINIAVVSGSIPPTGVPLPFVSHGGTSLVVFMAAIGIVLNISKQSKMGFEQSKQSKMCIEQSKKSKMGIEQNKKLKIGFEQNKKEEPAHQKIKTKNKFRFKLFCKK